MLPPLVFGGRSWCLRLSALWSASARICAATYSTWPLRRRSLHIFGPKELCYHYQRDQVHRCTQRDRDYRQDLNVRSCRAQQLHYSRLQPCTLRHLTWTTPASLHVGHKRFLHCCSLRSQSTAPQATTTSTTSHVRACMGMRAHAICLPHSTASFQPSASPHPHMSHPSPRVSLSMSRHCASTWPSLLTCSAGLLLTNCSLLQRRNVGCQEVGSRDLGQSVLVCEAIRVLNVPATHKHS
jgi:hypothetical protein